MADRYWVGGSGNWSSTSHWSTISGGASGASVPTSSDDVFFDQNSTYTVTMSTQSSYGKLPCKNFNVSSGTVTFDSGYLGGLDVCGTSFNINANTVFTSTSTASYMGYLTFVGSSGGQVTEVTTNGVAINKWVVIAITNVNMTLKLMDNLTVSPDDRYGSYSSFTLSGPSTTSSLTLDLNGNTLTINRGYFYAINRYSIAFGTGGKIILGWTTYSGDYIWNVEYGTLTSITGTGTVSYVGGYSTTGDTGQGKIFSGVDANGVAIDYTGITLDVSARSGNGNAILTITGANGSNTKFSGLTSNTSNANVKIYINPTSTIYLSGNSSCRLGTGNNIITLASSNTSNSSRFNIIKTQGTVTAQKLSVAACNVSGGAVFTSEYTYSYDRSNNSGWVFSETMFPALIQI